MSGEIGGVHGLGRALEATSAGAFEMGEEAERQTSFPYLDAFFHPLRDGRILLGHGTKLSVPAHWTPLLEGILYDALDMDELIRRARLLLPELTELELRERFARAGGHPNNPFGIASPRLRPRYDAIFLCQGYGGVFIQALEIWRKLSERYSVLLIAPERPKYGFPEDLADRMLIFEDLRENGACPSYFAFVQLVRSILNRVPHDLLYLEHRSQSIFTFDLLRRARRGTVIHDDGFYDSIYYGGAASHVGAGPRKRLRILKEVFNSLRYNPSFFYGLKASPLNNRRIMEAGWLAMRAADENWSYSFPAFLLMSGIYRSVRGRFDFVPPMVDLELRQEGIAYDSNLILYTTTMHNILRKGIVELCRAMQFLPPEIRATCVLGKPERLPGYVDPKRYRLDILPGVHKSDLVDLYHRSAVCVRVSREESSSVSVMEAMACGLPVITSRVAAENLPLLEDGVTGFIVSPSEGPRVLAERILRICREPELRERMSRACRERVADFGLQRQISRLTRYMREEPHGDHSPADLP